MSSEEQKPDQEDGGSTGSTETKARVLSRTEQEAARKKLDAIRKADDAKAKAAAADAAAADAAKAAADAKAAEAKAAEAKAADAKAADAKAAEAKAADEKDKSKKPGKKKKEEPAWYIFTGTKLAVLLVIMALMTGFLVWEHYQYEYSTASPFVSSTRNVFIVVLLLLFIVFSLFLLFRFIPRLKDRLGPTFVIMALYWILAVGVLATDKFYLDNSYANREKPKLLQIAVSISLWSAIILFWVLVSFICSNEACSEEV
jgi:cobalamin biosynthesis Mg chelatase CobN